MVKCGPDDEFLVSFLVDARGGYMQAQRLPQMKIFVPPDAAPSPTRIICHLLSPENVSNLPGINDCDGFASRILHIQSSCLRFQKPILIEMPHIALLRNGERKIAVMKRNFDSESWKEHLTTFNDETLKEEFGSLYESITPLDQLEGNRICRIITTEIPLYFSLISRFQRNTNLIGSEGGFIESNVDKRIKVNFPPGALLKKIPISLEVQNVDPSIINHVAGDNHKILVSPIITVEPKRRKFRDTIQMKISLPNGVPKDDYRNLKLLCSISEYKTKWEDVIHSEDLITENDCIVHDTKISARVWLIYAPGVEDVPALANQIYSLHCPAPYVGKFLAFARRHEQEECQLRCLLITDDTSDKTLECQESFELIATGPEIGITNKMRYQIETAGNLVAVTKSDEPILFEVQAFIENRITLPIRIRNTEESFSGKIAFKPKVQSISKQVIKPITTLDLIIPNIIVDMVGSMRNPERKHRVKNAAIERIKGCQAIAKAELDLKSVADEVGSDWCKLAEELGLNGDDINLVLNENCTSEDKAFMTLIQWQNNFGDRANGNELNRALRSIGREDVVKKCMDDIIFVENEDEVKSAMEQLNDHDHDKHTHDECWDGIVSPNSHSAGYNESVDDSMIVETGDDWSQSHREEKLSDVSDNKSLVMETTQENENENENENETEPEIIAVVDPSRAVVSDERTSSEKTAAFLILVDQLNEAIPEPVLPDVPIQRNISNDIEQTSVGELMSSFPVNMDINFDSELEGKICPVDVAFKLNMEPSTLLSQEDCESNPENDLETEPFDNYEECPSFPLETEETIHSQKHSVLHEVFESEPQTETEVEEETEILPDGSVVKRIITRRQISRTITEKSTREICPDDEDQLCGINLDNPTEVIETEEELPDGSIIKRRTTTSKYTTSSTSKIITEKEIENSEDIEICNNDNNRAVTCEIGAENVSEKPIIKPRKNKHKKKSKRN